ncbi:hypothetical protein KAR29_12565 [Aminithiophilus ramosus]|uniref:CRISPR-associated protein n=2 Tax=Aminithiophilus ramosus TaxID=3029084 RepID=A0A9Q7EV01_9BACT|nr:hypothetical protein KAR29_12565 [Aminithiophilus ramosus]
MSEKPRKCILTTVGTSSRNNLHKIITDGYDELLNNLYTEKAQHEISIIVKLIIDKGKLPDPAKILSETPSERMINAELQSLILWILNKTKGSKFESMNLVVILFPSKDPECILNAKISEIYIKLLDSSPYKSSFGINSIDCKIEDLDISVKSNALFSRGIDSLFKAFDEKRKDFHYSTYDFVINCTGGYKAVTAFSTLYGQIHQLPCIYTFESNDKDTLDLLPLPLSFALGQLDDEMALLRGLCSGDTLPLTKEQITFLPDWVRGLCSAEEDDSVRPLHLAQVLVDHYDRNRRKASGVGQGLLDEIRRRPGGEPLAAYIERRIANEWAELWLGDQIPETVEHSRRHSKRLMEIAANVFRSARPEDVEAVGLNDAKALALFVTAIYLHDIGHTALAFPVTPSGGGAFPLGLFPSSVREVHHLLSRDLILAEGEDLLPDDGSDLAPMLRELVPLVCAYHRGYTHLLKEQKTAQPKGAVSQVGKLLFGDEHFNETLRPLEEVLEAKKGKIAAWGLSIPKVLACAALLRVVDGCDVQADRTVDDVYLKARQKRTEKEGQALWQQLAFFDTKLPAELGNKLCELRDLIDSERIDSERIEDPLRVKDQAEAIKALTGDIYTAVFDDLIALKGSGDWAFINEDFEKIQALSLANCVAFKWEQFLHFRKHQAVGFVLPMPSADGKGVTIGIWPNNELRPDNAALEKVRESIQEELSGKEDDQARGKQRPGGVGDILESLGLKPEVMGERSDGR